MFTNHCRAISLELTGHSTSPFEYLVKIALTCVWCVGVPLGPPPSTAAAIAAANLSRSAAASEKQADLQFPAQDPGTADVPSLLGVLSVLKWALCNLVQSQSSQIPKNGYYNVLYKLNPLLNSCR